MSACERVLELAPQIEREQSSKVEAMWRDYVVAWLECNGHPEDLTRNSKDIHDLATTIVGKLQNPFITVDDTDLQIGALISGKENSCRDPSKAVVHRGADPVMSFNGQLVYETTDLSLNGAGIEFAFTRTYKNQVRFQGPLGVNWNHSYNHSLRVGHEALFRSTGDLQFETYLRHPRFGQSGFSYWMPPNGEDGVIVEHGNSFVWRAPHGVRHIFEQDPTAFLHRLARIEDRHGNFLQFSYADNRLSEVIVNHPERIVTFSYDEQNRIAAVRDFTGRQWSYCYDFFGDLISVTGPATGEYREGLTVCYEYTSSAQSSGDLQHNLTRIIDPAGRVFLENDYGTEAGLLRFNRVIRQRQGGGEYSFEYDDIPPEGDFDYTDEERPAHQTVRVERNGQPVCQIFNRFGQLLSETQRILEDGVVRTLTWRFRFNRDGGVVGALSPEGVMTQRLYGREFFASRHGTDTNGDVLTDALTLQERQAFGRLLALVTRAHHHDFSALNQAHGVWGDFFPDIIGAFDPDDSVVKFTYEPTYGQLLTMSDPRFTRSPDPAMQTVALGEHPRYEQTLTRHSYIGPAINPGSDPTRLLSEIRHPTPTLPDGTLGGPVVDRFTDYDERGRLLRAIDAGGLETVHAYFTAADGVLEGYRRQTVLDPAGLAITTRYDVDVLGRTVAVRAPRSIGAPPGHFVTRTVYNELNQEVAIIGSAPFNFTTRCFYDRSGKLTREERDARDETGADLPDGPEVRSFEYDDDLNLIEEGVGGRDPATRVVKRHRYGCAGQKLLTLLPEGNRIRYRYDERLLQTELITGADSDIAATTKTRYDGDSRVRTLIDARGHRSTFSCDPFGRVVQTEDRLGNITRRDFDKRDEVTVTRVFEKRDDGYYLVARSEASYDELGRQIRNAVNRFDAPQGPLQKQALATAFLTTAIPGGDLPASAVFFDARDRPVRTLDALQRETRYEYDALGRLHAVTDPLGNQVINRYDAHDNVVRRDCIDVLRDPDDPATITGQRVFSFASTYDELDRLSTRTDGLGNVSRFAYDSRGLLVRTVDPLGNVSKVTYDINRRRVSQCNELTVTGLGGSPLKELLEERFAYDRNGNLVAATDALGRRMEYRYDALDRRRTIIYPDGSQREQDYDADGHLVRTRDNNGVEHRYTTDALGRMTGIAVDTSNVTAGETGGATFERYAYDALNRRTREENDFIACTTEFNSLGSPRSETITYTVPGAPLQGPFRIEREFDEVGGSSSLRYPNGRTLRLERDALNRVTRIANVVNGADYPGDAAAPESYEIARFDFAGRQLVRCRNGNGTTTMYAQDGAARLIEIDHADSTASLLKIQYLFDGAGNVRTRHEITGAGERGEVFAYDSVRRLANVRDVALPLFDPVPLGGSSVPVPDPIPKNQDAIDLLIGPLELPPGDRTYEYDLAGNRVIEQNAATIEYTTNDLDQYTSVADATSQPLALSYDLNGNRRGDGARAYTYDSFNRLVRVSDGGVPIAEFFHDPRGRRILQKIAGEAVQIIWDGFTPISEYRDGTLSAQFVHAAGDLAQIAGPPGAPAVPGAEHWYHTDMVGSVRLLTTRNGLVAAAYQYEPFGLTLDVPADTPYNPFLYTGKRFDESLGTYDSVFRQYDPALGRFLQRDSVGTSEGSNLYTYAANAPLASTDPLGTEPRPEQLRAAAIEAYFKPFWERLAKSEEQQIYSMTAAMAEEYRDERTKRVQKVYRVYRGIVKEIQDATLADRDIDLNDLWDEYGGLGHKATGWMDICGKCYERPSLTDVGPFHGDLVNGVDVAHVFRVLTRQEQPNPTLFTRMFKFTTEAVILFGPDLLMGAELGMMRKGALSASAGTARVNVRLALTADEFLRTTPGSSIAMGTYGGGYEVFLENEARRLGYRTLGTSEFHAKRLGIEPPVPNSVRALGDEAIVTHEINNYLKPADRIGFWVTGAEVEFPTSITTMELGRVMDDPALFMKTQFYVNPLAVEAVPAWSRAPGVVTTVPWSNLLKAAK